MKTNSTTVFEVAESLLPEELHRSFDCALPLGWTDVYQKKTGRQASGHFVWLYDGLAASFGRPFPLTADAREGLLEFNKSAGTCYPTTQRSKI